MGIIYKITNNINQKVYIGQTTNPLEHRWQQHKYAINDKNRNFTLYLAMRKYGLENFKIEQIGEYPNSLLDQKEREWIAFYDSYNNGYNMTPGGDGSINEIDIDEIVKLWEQGFGVQEIANEVGYDRSVVRRQLQQLQNYTVEEANERGKRGSIKAKQKKVYIYTLKSLYKYFSTVAEASEDLKITQRTLRKKCHDKKYSKGLFYSYEPLTLTQRLNILKQLNLKPVKQYDLDGKVVNIYGCIAEAERETKINNISKAIENKKSAGNFQWRYYEDNLEQLSKYDPIHNKRRVQQFDLEGRYIKTFDSLTAAAKEVGAANTTGITIACQNQERTAKGYKWKYEEDNQ